MKTNNHQTRIGIVLSAGGLRGVAHLGILRQLLLHGVPIDSMVGVSAGAIIAAFYAGVGLSIEEMINEAHTFRGRHIVLHGLGLRAPQVLKPYLRRMSGVVPQRLQELDRAKFDTLHFGINRLGIVCHDLVANRPLYFATGANYQASLAEVVKASATIPGIIPSRVIERGGQKVHLVDGGVSDSLPVEFARSRTIQSTHLIVSDCRSISQAIPSDDKLVYIRPDLDGITALRSSRTSLPEAVKRGEAAVTRTILSKIKGWLKEPKNYSSPEPLLERL